MTTTAGALLTSSALRVSAEDRLAGVLSRIQEQRATHVVVVDGGQILGAISLRALLGSNPQTIFADLVRRHRLPMVAHNANVEYVGHLFEEMGIDGAAVHGPDGGFWGVVTHDELIRALLRDAHARIDEITRLKFEQERLRVLGQISSGVAHDLNNSLTPVIGHLELLRLWFKPEERPHRCAELALLCALDAASAVKRLHGFYSGNSEGGSSTLVDLRDLVKDVRAMAKPKWRDEAQRVGKSIEIVVQLDPVRPVLGNPGELREVLMNLLINAVDAIPEAGTIRLRTGERDDQCFFEVSDTGIGMTDEQKVRCFEPFYTTKVGRGTGLGLSVSSEIIKSLGGSFEFETAPLRGTTFRVLLPMDAAKETSPAPPVSTELSPWSILYIDNDPRLHDSVKGMLEALGQRVELSAGGKEGIDAFRTGRHDLVITDFTMPGIGGADVLRSVRTIRPDAAVMMVTGWIDNALIENAFPEDKPNAVLNKPFTLPELRAAIASIQRSREA